MGKGDKKTKKGKINSGSYGVSRKKKKKNAFVVKPKAKKKAAPKKEAPEKKTTASKKPAAKKTTAKKTADK